jgi:ribosomal protein S18 acetylase RimI-like enzyme
VPVRDSRAMTGKTSRGWTFEIRRADDSDWEAYRALRLRSLEQDPLAFGSTVEREKQYPPDLWQSRLFSRERPEGAATFVASVEGVGFVGTVAAVDVEGTLHIFAMWVDPAYRGARVGRELLATALRWIREHHPGRDVVLEVNPRQAAAAHLYESRGFRRTGKASPLGHTPGETVVEMRLGVEPSGPTKPPGPPAR